MKSILIYLLTLILIMPIAYAESSAPIISIVKYEPYPAEPGKYLDVWIKTENKGTSDILDVSIRIDPKYPFEAVEGQSLTKDIGILKPTAADITKFRIKIKADAVQGENYLDIYYISTGKQEIGQKLPIFIQNKDATLSIQKIYKEDQLKPGNTYNVTLELKNEAGSYLTDVSVRLNLSGNDLPFAPVSSSEQRAYIINAEEIKNITFPLIVLSNAESGIYKIPVSISYQDSIGTKYTLSDIISLKVGDTPKVEAFLEQNNVYKGTGGKASIKLVNRGLIELKFMKVEIYGSNEFKLTSPNQVYIGNLDPDDTESLELEIIPKTSTSFTMKLKLDYLDANNKPYVEDREVTISPLSKPLQISWWLIVVIVSLGSFLGYKWYKKAFKR